MYDRLRMASSPFDNNYIFLIGKIDLEPFFLAKQIMNNQIEHDDLAIVKLPEAEMDMTYDEVCRSLLHHPFVYLLTKKALAYWPGYYATVTS